MNQCTTPAMNQASAKTEIAVGKVGVVLPGNIGIAGDIPLDAIPVITPAKLEILLHRAFFMARAAFDEAENSYSHYDVEDTDGDADTCTFAQIRQPKPMHLSVIVHTIDDTCTCSIFRTAVLPLRARLLESGLTVMELQAGRQWPTCKHPIITAFLQAMEPGKFAACLAQKSQMPATRREERGH